VTARPLVIIGCGADKRDVPSAAGQLYTGAHFRMCLATALAIADRGDVLILSALYGLLRLDDLVAPYDLTMGERGAVKAGELFLQAAALDVAGRPVIALCGRAYADVLAQVFADVRRPLAGLGIGEQRHALAELRDGGRLVGDDQCGTPDMFAGGVQ
jgi:hypothetical protein